MALVSAGTWTDGATVNREAILDLATQMLPAHQSYSPDLYAEMVATGEAAGLSPAEMIVVGGFTDFADAVRGEFGSAPIEDACTAFIVPDDRADGAGFYGQTWDMHDSATEHIVMFEVEGGDDPRALVFTTVGCVGQMGMNDAGIAIGINNLTATGGIGVTWPFVVRKALQQRTIEDATACVVDADLAGAHNYLLFDRDGNGVSIEAMPDALGVEMLEEAPVVHTNHCRRSVTKAEEAPRPEPLQASSEARLTRALDLLDGATFTVDDLMAVTRDPEAICQVSAPPYHVESCGAVIMRPKTGEFWAVAGRPDLNEYERFSLA
jgi:isopenicillin-N N-acyltransferase-like protein